MNREQVHQFGEAEDETQLRAWFSDFVSAHHAELMDFARKKMLVVLRGRFDAEDFVQEALYQLWQYRHKQFVDERHVLAWVCRAVKNKITNVYRNATTLKNEPKEGICRQFNRDGEPADPAGTVPEPSAEACARDLEKALKEEVSSSAVRTLELVTAGHSESEIAQRLGVSVRTVQRRMAELRLGITWVSSPRSVFPQGGPLHAARPWR